MQRAVVAIGVRKTGNLPELQAAVQGAEAFAAWAKTHQRISRVRLITDAKSAVTRDRIFKAINDIVELGYIEQLMVYFSGHGINVGQGERWLLSRAPDDPAAAVNVRGSELSARFCGIGHVVLVSDACRTAADSIQAQSVTGSEIFPNKPPSGPERPVDQFYAALLGQPALEVKSVQESARVYRAAYSEVLLRALRGDAPDVIETVGSQRLVRAWPLKKHLARAVPEFLRQLHVPSGVMQQPDARIESDPEAWLSLCPAGPVPAPAAAADSAKRRRPGGRRAVPLREEAGLPPTAMESDALGPAGLDEDARQALRLLLRGESPSRRRRAGRPGMLAATGTASPVTAATSRAALTFAPRDFETHCGVALRGLRVADAVARNMALQVGSRRDAVQAALPGRRRVDNVVLVLEDRSVVVVPVLAGYVTSLSFDGDGLLDDVACEPAAATAAARARSDAGESMRRLRAVVAGTSRLGVFRLDDEVVAERLIERLRADSAPDAAMAVLAAYALHDRRMRESIRQLHGHLTRTLGAGIFDVALLAFALTAGAPPVYPCVPMLTQGWSLLAPLGVSLPGRLGELSGSLRPSLWTHFAADAAAVIIDEIRKGKVE